MWKSIIVTIISVIFLVNSTKACKGCLELDVFTFDKVISKFKAAIVKFDVAYPYGEAHEQFEKFAGEVGNVSISGNTDDLVIGTVGIKDYGEKENADLGLRFGVKTDSVFPVIKLFLNGNLKKPIDYSQENKVTTINLYKFLKQYSDVYIPIPGCIKELDEIVKKFIGDKSKRTDLLNDAEKFTNELKCEQKQKSGKVYVALMKRIIEKGDSFIKTEQERVEKLLAGKISDSKKKDLNDRLNILDSFKFAESKDEL